MKKLFDDMNFEEKINHIKKCQKEALEYIRAGESSQLADIADHVDIWGPWMLEQLAQLRKENELLALVLNTVLQRAKMDGDAGLVCYLEDRLEALSALEEPSRE